MKPLEQLIQQLDREEAAAPVEAHGYRVQPVARVRGWWGELPTDAAPSDATVNATGGGAFLRVTPLAVEVEQAGKAPYRIALTDTDQPSVRGFLIGGLVIAVVAGVINVLIRLRYGQ